MKESLKAPFLAWFYNQPNISVNPFYLEFPLMYSQFFCFSCAYSVDVQSSLFLCSLSSTCNFFLTLFNKIFYSGGLPCCFSVQKKVNLETHSERRRLPYEEIEAVTDELNVPLPDNAPFSSILVLKDGMMGKPCR